MSLCFQAMLYNPLCCINDQRANLVSSSEQCPCLEEVNIKIWPSLSHGAFLFHFAFSIVNLVNRRVSRKIIQFDFAFHRSGTFVCAVGGVCQEPSPSINHK